jgi:DNA-binding NtrC family response regulator
MANILVIDDDEAIRDLLEMILTIDKHDVTLAEDGEQGMKLYSKNTYDLIITDIIMPNKDGIDLIADMVNTDNPTPIIAMSGGRRKITSDFNLQSAASMGVKETLKKPFTELDLRRAIKRILG